MDDQLKRSQVVEEPERTFQGLAVGLTLGIVLWVIAYLIWMAI